MPLAETLRAVDDPWGYARATLGYPWKGIASRLGIHSDKLDGGYHDYMTYGKPVDGKFVLNSVAGAIPGAQQGLDALGLSEFPDQGVSGFVRGQTGFGLVKRPSPFMLAAKSHEDDLRQQIHDASLQGDTATVDALQRKLQYYIGTH